MRHLVSIVMPSFNTADFIYKAIESVVAQTYSNWELIIIDDCSTDGTRGVVEAWNDKRIRYFTNEANVGAAESRNIAIMKARGKWIAFLDSDDLWMSDKLEKQIAFMEKNNVYFSYTNYIEIDLDGNELGIRVTGPKKITTQGMYNYCWPGCLTVMYDKDKVGVVQIANIKKNNDYAMWLKISRLTNCYLFDDVLAKYRRGRTDSISNNTIKVMIGWHFKLFREAENQFFLLALINTFRNICFGIWKKVKYVKKYNISSK